MATDKPTLVGKSTVYISLTVVVTLVVSVFSAANWIVNRIDEGSKTTTESMERIAQGLERQVDVLRLDVQSFQGSLTTHQLDYAAFKEKVCMKSPTYERLSLLEHRVSALEADK